MNALLKACVAPCFAVALLAFGVAEAAWERPVKTYRKILGHGLSIDVHISNEDRRYATVEFNSNRRHMGVVMLSPLRPEQFNLSFMSDTQSIHVERLSLVVPQADIKGEVSIECNFVTVNEGPLLEYEGLLAQWKLPN